MYLSSTVARRTALQNLRGAWAENVIYVCNSKMHVQSQDGRVVALNFETCAPPLDRTAPRHTTPAAAKCCTGPDAEAATDNCFFSSDIRP